jgi:phosphoglycolate phosphatase
MRKKLSAYRHAVWDWNGTLLDDTWLCCEALNQILAEENKPLLDPDHYRQIFEFPAMKVYHKLGFPVDLPTFEKLSVRFMAAYEARKHHCNLHIKALEVIEILSAHGLTHSVLSAYEHKRLQDTLNGHSLQHHFIKASGGGDIYAHSKEDRARLHLADLPHQPDEVIFIGDTAHDLEAAQAMGVDCLLLGHGYQHPDRLTHLGVRVLNNFSEILSELS